MSLAVRLQKKAQAAIAKYGTPLTLTQNGAPAYDPATSSVTATAAPISVSGIVEHVRLFRPDQESAPGGDVGHAQWKVTLAALDLTTPPARGDTIGPIEGLVCKVTGVSSEQVQGATITYQVRVSA